MLNLLFCDRLHAFAVMRYHGAFWDYLRCKDKAGQDAAYAAANFWDRVIEITWIGSDLGTRLWYLGTFCEWLR